jgi:predicted amidohydrolase
MLKDVKVAAIQTIVLQDKESGERQVTRLVEQAVLGGARIVGLPEDCIAPSLEMKAGYDPFTFLSGLAKKHQIYLFGATMYQEKESLRNVGFIFDPEGVLLARHNKTVLTPLEEAVGLIPGNSLSVFKTEFGTTALLVCKDAFHRYAAWYFEELRKAHVDIVLAPSYSLTVTKRSVSLWTNSLIALANWFDMYIVAPGTIGDNTTDFPSFGHALIISPLDGVLSEGSLDKEEILEALLKVKALMEVRNTYGAKWQPKEPPEVSISAWSVGSRSSTETDPRKMRVSKTQ